MHIHIAIVHGFCTPFWVANTQKIRFYFTLHNNVKSIHLKSAIVILAGKVSCHTYQEDSHSLVRMLYLVTSAICC